MKDVKFPEEVVQEAIDRELNKLKYEMRLKFKKMLAKPLVTPGILLKLLSD